MQTDPEMSSLHNSFKETVHWLWRWIIYAIILITGFYTFENLRGTYAIHLYQNRCEKAGEWLVRPTQKKDTWLTHLLESNKLTVVDTYDPRDLFSSTGRTVRYGYQACRKTPFKELFYFDGISDKASEAESYLKISSQKTAYLHKITPLIAKADCLGGNIDYIQTFDYLTLVRRTNYALYFRAAAKIQNHSGQEAISDIATMIKLCNILIADDYLINSLIAATFFGQINNLVWEGISLRVWTPEQLNLITDLLDRLPHTADVPVSTFYSERAFAWENRYKLFTLSGRIEANSDIQDSLLDLRSVLPSPHNWRDALSDYTSNLLVIIIPNGWYKLAWIRSQENVRGILAPSTTRLDTGIPFICWNFMGDAIGGNLPDKFTEAAAHIRLAKVAIAMEQYKNSRESYPNSLAELKMPTDVTEDPFSGADLKFIPAGTRSAGPVIYSIGQNRKDDRGFPYRDRRKGDIVWQYEFPGGFTFEDYKTGP